MSARAAGLVVVALAAAACGGAAKPGVTVSQLQSDVSFGTVASPTPVAASAAAGMAPTLPGVPAPGQPAFQFDNQSKGPLTPIVGGYGSGRQVCADPPIGASAGKAVTYPVQGTPAPGYYLYGLTSGKIVASQPFVLKRTFVNLHVLPASKPTTIPNPSAAYPQTKFTYQEVQPEPGGTFITFTIDVVNYPISEQQANGEGLGPNVTGGADDGVSIVAEKRTDATGKVLWSFNPSTPVTLIPLPVTSGTTFASTGTDPVTGQSLSIKGVVAKTDRLVGCGVFIQGWQVQATQVGRAPAPDGTVQVLNGDAVYDVATQYGGLVIASRYTPTGSTTFTGAQIGTITPTKQPAKTS